MREFACLDLNKKKEHHCEVPTFRILFQTTSINSLPKLEFHIALPCETKRSENKGLFIYDVTQAGVGSGGFRDTILT